MKVQQRVATQVGAMVAAGEAAEARGDFASAAASFQALADAGEPTVAAEGQFRLGCLAWRQSRFETALTHYERARELARVAGNRDLEARAHNGTGAVHYARGEYAQAQASYRVAMDLTEEPDLRGRFLLNLGVLANIQGDLASAAQSYSRACAVFREHGDRASEALALHNLGMLHADREEWDEADDAYRRALTLFEEQGNRPLIASVLVNRCEVLIARRALADAVHQCQLASAVYAEIGDECGRGEAQRWQGRALRERGDLAAAERCLTDAVHVAVRHRVKLLEAEASRELAAVKRAANEPAAATRWAKRALAIFRELGATREIAEMEAVESRENGSRESIVDSRE